MPGRAGHEDLVGLSAPLRADVRRLSSVLGDVMSANSEVLLLEDVERLRKACIALRGSRGSETDLRLSAAVELVDGFALAQAESVALAFTVYFHLVNLAEERHRVRILRERSRTQAVVAESLAATIADLRAELGELETSDLVARLDIRPVLTAHPTEARRRAVVDAVRRIARVMDTLDDARLSASERLEAERQLNEQVSILWRTAQLRGRRPTPLDEVRSLMSVFDESLFGLVPIFYRELERAQGISDSEARPRIRPLIRWGSWVGGDRDGNPHVTAAVTETTLSIQSTHVLLGLETAARRIGRTLTLSEESTPASRPLLESLRKAEAELGPSGAETRSHSASEPHRAALLLAAERLRATRLVQPGSYASADDFVGALDTVQESLFAAGAGVVARGELQHLIWQAETFGFHLASLEVRQHSSVHRAVLSEVLGDGEQDAPALDALAAGPDAASVTLRTPLAREVFATLRAMARLQARYGTEACRRYVVSFTSSASDVVAVAALGKLAVPGGRLELDVVPLFESRADLEAAPEVLDRLLELPGWRAWLESRGRRLEVMLGYSDATKDAGFLAANLALYGGQSALIGWARRNQVDLTLFHGRGGAVGRGGGPAGRAIRSQAPGSLSNHFKVTEQGEVIFARYGNSAIALRHLEQVASAVLTASTHRHEERLAVAELRFRESARLMAERSEAVYRDLVESPGFADFFARVTPLEEIGRLAIGSRPSRRSTQGPQELDQLRAIPWVFAWTQSRCNLPGWFGLGSGLQALVDREGLDHLRRMVAEWPFLASVLDNAEMSLAKADPIIAGLYLARGGRPDIVDAIRDEYRLTRRLVLAATGDERLLARHPILGLAVDLRNPYVDALSLLQLRFLRELDGPGMESNDRLSAAVRLTVGGIAAGLQNTG